jgi:hypothetical protein
MVPSILHQFPAGTGPAWCRFIGSSLEESVQLLLIEQGKGLCVLWKRVICEVFRDSASILSKEGMSAMSPWSKVRAPSFIHSAVMCKVCQLWHHAATSQILADVMYSLAHLHFALHVTNFNSPLSWHMSSGSTTSRRACVAALHLLFHQQVLNPSMVPFHFMVAAHALLSQGSLSSPRELHGTCSGLLMQGCAKRGQAYYCNRCSHPSGWAHLG